MRARKLLLASAFTAAVAAGGLASIPAASAASGYIHGFGTGNQAFIAQVNADANARGIAASNGFDPYNQCSLASSQVSQGGPNLYYANVTIYCQN